MEVVWRHDIELRRRIVELTEIHNSQLTQTAGRQGGIYSEEVGPEGRYLLMESVMEALLVLTPGSVEVADTWRHGAAWRAASLAGIVLTRSLFSNYNNRSALHAGWELFRAEGGVPCTDCDVASWAFLDDFAIDHHEALTEDELRPHWPRLLDLYRLEGVCARASSASWLPDKKCHGVAAHFKAHQR